MDVTLVATSVAVMGFMIAIGFFFAMKVPITAEVKNAFILIVLNIAVPAIILDGIFTTDVTDELFTDALLIFAISVVFHLAALLISWTAVKLLGFDSLFAKKMAVLAALGNAGFIGIPLSAVIFGPVGGLLAAVFNAGLDLVIFTVVIYMLQSGSGLPVRKVAKSLANMPLMAVIAGFIVALTGFSPPEFLSQLTGHLAGLAAPLSMVYIGILLHHLFLKSGLALYRLIWLPVSLRLIIFPVLIMLVLSFTPLNDSLRHLVIILAAMPTFTLSAIIFGRYLPDGSEDTAVITIAASTLLSLATIPFIAFLSSVF
ncbi:AEC family transporter [Salipaludibacillus aurantiacus]|uniref:Membrane transport protein n=1 Tax=Salipaludibacillus aurantiacus TaxID=1601833 RepID=A0A1H9WZP5_9BACI|nr:AEC family transporter [Salipaludibacillus aurantiacus]SES38863.1 hypothetical protein SAMN05518684_12149 [Salipaludibacillus aurantiacus]